MTHPFTEADALKFAHDLNRMSPPGPTLPPPAQPTPPAPPTDAGPGGGGDGEDSFDVEVIVQPPGGALYRSMLELAPNPTAEVLIQAVLQAATGTLAQFGVHVSLIAATYPKAAPMVGFTRDPRPDCDCSGCTARRARNGGGQ